MKQLLCSLIAAAALISFACAMEVAPENTAHAAILVHMDSGDVLYEKNADERMLIASITKLMTALVVSEQCDLQDEVTVSREDCAVEGSSVYLKPGESYTVEELLYGLLLSSGNDAATALARYVGGSAKGFAELMNQKAESLGLNDTHFSNPHGLDAEDHYSSAADVAKIMSNAMRSEIISQILGTKSRTVGETTCINHNKLLWNYEGCIGGKTGYTMAAGRTLVSCAERDGLRLICVTLSDPNDWNDHAALYDWGFENWEFRHVVPFGTIAELPVISGEQKSVRIEAAQSPGVLVSRGSVTDIRLELPEFVYADVQAGTAAGTLVVTVNQEFALRTDLYFSESVHIDDSVRLTSWEKIKRAWYIANRYGGMGYYGVLY